MIKYFLLIIFLSINFVYAQDSLAKFRFEKPFNLKKIVVPAGLIGGGAIIKMPLIENNLQKNTKKIFGGNFHTRVDDYTQYLPLVGIFSGHFLGLKSEHTYKQIATNIVISSLITGGIVTFSKNEFSSMRPDNSARNSFPSGHSALSFNLATIQFLEYKNSNIWYAGSGFLIATATACMRVANNRHWVGDILAGAGTGMAIAIIINYWNPLINLNLLKKVFSKKSSSIGFPIINKNSYGVAVLINI